MPDDSDLSNAAGKLTVITDLESNPVTVDHNPAHFDGFLGWANGKPPPSKFSGGKKLHAAKVVSPTKGANAVVIDSSASDADTAAQLAALFEESGGTLGIGGRHAAKVAPMINVTELESTTSSPRPAPQSSSPKPASPLAATESKSKSPPLGPSCNHTTTFLSIMLIVGPQGGIPH